MVEDVRSNSSPRQSTADDVWIPTTCDMCYAFCGIRVHRANGIVVRIEGDPDDPQSRGKICAKGQAGLMGLYHPKRVTRPLKRTNPSKGIGVDPGWVEIGWEEALDTVAEKVRQVREKDPRRIILSSFDLSMGPAQQGFRMVFPNTPFLFPASMHCGAALHTVCYATNASFHSEIDLEYCQFCILFGCQHGFGVGLSSNINTQKMADARRRGMKVVVVDPRCGEAAAKADEWIPIRPGTDAALALSMINVLLNELGIYDADFLKKHTNAPYLVLPEGRYARDEATGKPLVWDLDAGLAVPYDCNTGDVALEGDFESEGAPCRPAFHVLKDHVRSYSPERVFEITSVPAETTRRLAQEFGQAARIGAKIVIEGQELPFRPVAAHSYKGSQGHKHGGMTALSIQLINLVSGALYVPGSIRGSNSVSLLDFGGNYFSGHNPGSGHDGMIVPAHQIIHGKTQYDFYNNWPRDPDEPNLKHFFPLAYTGCADTQLLLHTPEKFKSTYQAEVLIQCRNNLMMTTMDPLTEEEILRKIPFIVNFTQVLEETSEFADIVFPDAHNLERLDFYAAWGNEGVSINTSTGYWYWRLRQPVVQPPEGVRQWGEVMLQIADRAGFLGTIYEAVNLAYPLVEPYKLEPDRRYTWAEILDRAARSMFGPEHELDWFKEHGVLKVKRRVEEIYPLPSIKPRIPVYYEHWLDAGDYVKNLTQELDVPWDLSDFQPLPDWRPCHGSEQDSARYDLWAVNYRLPFHTFSHTSENPWLNELSERQPYAHNVMMNSQTAETKGIKDGETVWVESSKGQRVSGRAKVSECIHPEVVAIAGVFGHWAKGRAIAKGQGVHFNSLLALDTDRVDMISGALDSCVKVRVYKGG